MMKSVMAEADGHRLLIADLGYYSDDATVARWKQARDAGVPNSRFSVEATPGRLFMEIAPTKLAALMRDLPLIEGSTYWRATHHWQGLAADDPPQPKGAPE